MDQEQLNEGLREADVQGDEAQVQQLLAADAKRSRVPKHQVLDDAHINLLCCACGISHKRIMGSRSTYVASPETFRICMDLQGMGYMIRNDESQSNIFCVTPKGQLVAKRHVLDEHLQELLDDLIAEEACIAAAETVGPNSHEYEHMTEYLQESKDLRANVGMQLLRQMHEEALHLRDVLSGVLAHMSESGPKSYLERKSVMADRLAQAEALLGRSSTLIENDSDVVLVKPHFAVFQMVPNQPFAWVDASGPYIKTQNGSFVRCEPMDDGRIAVLKTKLGPALEGNARRQAEQISEGEGIVIAVHSSGWPTNDECYKCFREQMAAHEQTDECGEGLDYPQERF